jgi:hypothetical protein
MSGSVVHPGESAPVLVSTAVVKGDGGLINGVFGGSQKQIGVVGMSETSIGVLGDGATVGVNGSSGTGTGVRGESDSGNGIEGLSQNGIGVHGKGRKLAGLFEGKVTVTDRLTVPQITLGENGEDLVALIAQLQSRIDALELSRVTRGGVPVSGPATRPTIAIELHLLATGQALFSATGSGFQSLAKLTFSIFNRRLRTQQQNVQPLDSTNAHQDGTIQTRGQFNYERGDVLEFSATDGTADPSDLTGQLWSNTEIKSAA